MPDKALAPNSLKVVDSYITENVIIVTMDGMRIYESLADPDHQYTPHLWNDLRPQGATNFFMQLSVAPSSIPGHYTILTGTREVLALDGNDLEGYRPRVPTIFEYYRKTFTKPETSAFYISSLPKGILPCVQITAHIPYGANRTGQFPQVPMKRPRSIRTYTLGTLRLRLSTNITRT